MSRNYDLYLQDIVTAADRITSYVEDVTRGQFEMDQIYMVHSQGFRIIFELS